MKKSTIASLAVLIALIPATLFLGSRLTGRWYYLISTLVILETMVPFFFVFEKRKPQARELVTIAVMAAIAAASRAAFAFLPNIKPITAIIMITGIALGPEAGFLTGTVSAFASNFVFGQGPWTPWQMLAYGLGGFLSGLLFHKRKLSDSPVLNSVLLAIYSFLAILLVVGPLMDVGTVLVTAPALTGSYVWAVLVSGLPINLIHGASAAATMLLLSQPLLSKLERIKTKYGMLEAHPDGL